MICRDESIPRVYVATPADSPQVSSNAYLRDAFLRHNVARPDASFAGDVRSADVVVLMQEFRFRLPDEVAVMLADPFLMGCLPNVYVVNYDDFGRGFLPGLYTSLTPRLVRSDLHRPCVYPKWPNELAVPERSPAAASPRWLFSFRGTRHTARVREHLFASFGGAHKQWLVAESTRSIHEHTPETKRQYVQEILESAYVLCPRGWSPSTYRLFEAMALGRCPVVISDDWVAIPGIDWDTVSVRVPERSVAMLPRLLAGLGVERGLQMGVAARRVWEQHFSEVKRFHGYLSSILDLRRQRPPGYPPRAALAYWHSRAFRRGNRWTLGQRLLDAVRLRVCGSPLR